MRNFILLFLAFTALVNACDYHVSPSSLPVLLNSQNSFTKLITTICFEAGTYTIEPRTKIIASMKWHGPFAGVDNNRPEKNTGEAVLTTSLDSALIFQSPVTLEIEGFTLKSDKAQSISSSHRNAIIFRNNIVQDSKNNNYNDYNNNIIKRNTNNDETTTTGGGQTTTSTNETTTGAITSGGQLPVNGVVIIRVWVRINSDVTTVNFANINESLSLYFGTFVFVEAYYTDLYNSTVTVDITAINGFVNVSAFQKEAETQTKRVIEEQSFIVLNVESEVIHSGSSGALDTKDEDKDGGISRRNLIIIICCTVGGTLLIGLVVFLIIRSHKNNKRNKRTSRQVSRVRLASF